MTYNIYVYNLIGGKMAVSKEILDLIPEGCKVNWNEKQQRFYVYKSTYYYSKEHKRSREQRTQVGTIVNGVFTYAKSYLLKQQIKDLKQEVKSSTADDYNRDNPVLRPDEGSYFQNTGTAVHHPGVPSLRLFHPHNFLL